MNQKVKKVLFLKVGDFVAHCGEELKMTPLNGDVGFEREITEPSVNRPGLALSGFLDYFAEDRVQVLGNSEFSYIEKNSIIELEDRWKAVLETGAPCFVVARDESFPQELLDIATEYKVSVFRSPLTTMEYMNQATFLLEEQFAETTNLHGCMISYNGVGMLIMGKSGTGKSEAAIGLIENGGALVADDKVKIKKANGKLSAFTEAFSRGFIEMRGVGIINVANLYGLGAIREICEVELIVFLRPESDLNQVDRVGANRQTYDVLGVGVPYVEIPVAPGRDTARLISVTAMDFQLRKMGYDMAEEFNRRILSRMANPGN